MIKFNKQRELLNALFSLSINFESEQPQSQIFYTQASKFFEAAHQNVDPIGTLKNAIDHGNQDFYLDFFREYSRLKDDELKQKVAL